MISWLKLINQLAIYLPKEVTITTLVYYIWYKIYLIKTNTQEPSGLNAHYLVIFKNPRDASQITHLAKQMYPGHVQFLQEVFRDATSEAYGYLFIDLKQETPEHLRLRTKIMPNETQYVYMRKT